jgi:flavin reductase (DIM6/NTAB) family NADH-FMN oxidoreductase RutF
VKSDLVDAPLIKEFPFALECNLLHTLEIGVHIQFIGEIVDIKAEEEMLNDQGVPDIDNVKPVIFAPEMQAYYGVGKFLGKAFSIGKEI